MQVQQTPYATPSVPTFAIRSTTNGLHSLHRLRPVPILRLLPQLLQSVAQISHWQRDAELQNLKQVRNEQIPGQHTTKEEDAADGHLHPGCGLWIPMRQNPEGPGKYEDGKADHGEAKDEDDVCAESAEAEGHC